MLAHGFATPRERGGNELIVVVGDDRTARSSDHAGDTDPGPGLPAQHWRVNPNEPLDIGRAKAILETTPE